MEEGRVEGEGVEGKKGKRWKGGGEPYGIALSTSSC